MLKLFRAVRLRETLPYMAIILGGILVASLLHYCPAHNYAANATSYQETNSLLLGISPEGWTAIFTGTLTVSTIGLWIVSLKAANAAKRGADIAERTLNDLETPFLYPVVKADDTKESFKLFVLYDHPNSPADDKCTPGVSFRIKNFGRTPALLRSVAAEFDHWTEMLASPRYDVLPDYSVEPVLEPHIETARTFKKYLVIPVDKDGFNSIKDGNSRLFLHGECVFSDIFGAEYLQTFCLAWDYRSKGFIPWFSRYNRRQRKETTAPV